MIYKAALYADIEITIIDKLHKFKKIIMQK